MGRISGFSMSLRRFVIRVSFARCVAYHDRNRLGATEGGNPAVPTDAYGRRVPPLSGGGAWWVGSVGREPPEPDRKKGEHGRRPLVRAMRAGRIGQHVRRDQHLQTAAYPSPRVYVSATAVGRTAAAARHLGPYVLRSRPAFCRTTLVRLVHQQQHQQQ